jgi:hypothetical protein
VVKPRNPLVRLRVAIRKWLGIEEHASSQPVDRAPPVQPYPRGYTNGAYDPDKTPSEYPHRKGDG